MSSIFVIKLLNQADDLMNFKSKLTHFINKSFLNLYKNFDTIITIITMFIIVFKSYKFFYIFIKTFAILSFLMCNILMNVLKIQLNSFHFLQVDNSFIFSITFNKRS